MNGHVYFIGAGPGDPDLITVKGRTLIAQADLVLWADSLVHPGVVSCARSTAVVEGTASMALGEIVERMVAAARAGLQVARVHSGDPAIYGAIHEQIVALEAAEVPYTIVPGVSSAFAAAARLGVELTVPDVAQTVIFTRVARRTRMPERERLRDVAAGGGTIVLFLSLTAVTQVVEELRAAGWSDDTPAAVAYRVTWADEQLIRCRLADLPAQARAARITKQALILVGAVLAPERPVLMRSHLYHEAYSHLFRQADAREDCRT